jgi:hypothetical protein
LCRGFMPNLAPGVNGGGEAEAAEGDVGDVQQHGGQQ